MSECTVCQAEIETGELCTDCQRAADLVESYRQNPSDPKWEKPGPYPAEPSSET